MSSKCNITFTRYFTCPEPLALEVHQYKKIVNDSVAKMIKAKAGGN